MAVSRLPPRYQAYARAIDDGFGNKDGQLASAELDRFERLYGTRAEHREPIAALRHALDAGSASTLGRATVESTAAARRLVGAGGSGDASDVEAVVAEVARLPAAILHKAEAAGLSFVACRTSVTDHVAELRGERPRGWPPGVTWDDVPGLYRPSAKEVVIATLEGAGGGRQVPPSGSGHGSASLVAHELLHGLDYARALDRFGASDPDFRAAWRADRGQLPGYLAQDPPAGPEEAFAELAARALLGDDAPAASAPHISSYLEDAARAWGVDR